MSDLTGELLAAVVAATPDRKEAALTAAGAEARHRRAMRMFPELSQLFILKTTRMKMRQEA